MGTGFVSTTVVAVIFLVSCCWAITPVWKRAEDGRLSVSVPDFPGTQNVTVTVNKDYGQEVIVFIPNKSADNTWRTVIEGISKNDVIGYVIEYRLPDTHHRVTGSYSPEAEESETGLTLGSEHYLRRRATTVFYDDFSSGHIDSKKWTHDIMAVGMGHFQIWSPESRNSYVKNGILYIKPTLTTDRFGSDIMNHGTIDVKHVWGACRPVWGSDSCVTHDKQNRPVMSALLRSSGAIKYGKVEVVAKLPKGDWLWPAIWMMPKESHYGGWPQSGEIDIMEAMGNLHMKHPNGLSVGADCDHSTIHYGNGRDGTAHARHGEQYRLHGTTFGDAFHTFWLDWTESHIRIGVDDHTVLTVNTPSQGFWNEAHLQGNNIWAHGGKSAPFDRPFYLILNVAVGGGFFWDGYINTPYKRPWSNGNNDYYEFWQNRHLWLPTWHGEDTAMKVKSVKMQQY
ncbi:hypothetical protein V1264_020392 [Littorina saxatilis]|uniref:GH16 domain-containing protein n=2 Tax=Littorina saxatilis TaxID=31220 RepID=A0AAN9GC39_9CAEN